MTGPPPPHDVADAWAVLRDHPALMWVPPLWRGAPDGPVYRAVERNLLVEVVGEADGHSAVRLATGPLRDRVVGDGVDPVAPVAERDGRLDVRAATFEDAVRVLAERVLLWYGPCGPAIVGDAPGDPAAGPHGFSPPRLLCAPGDAAPTPGPATGARARPGRPPLDP